ncbi:MAG TPA: DUF4190 domain-containing protein [Ktedonobacterales bacterium]
MTNPSPYGEYPQYQQPTGPTTQQPYPSQPYEPYQPQPSYPAPEQQPYAAYAPPQQPYPMGYAPPMGPGPTSGMAIASLVCSLLGIGLVGVILGHLALNEIKRTNGYTQGRGLAIAGLIIGYLQIAAGVVIVAIVIISIAFSANTTPQP